MATIKKDADKEKKTGSRRNADGYEKNEYQCKIPFSAFFYAII